MPFYLAEGAVVKGDVTLGDDASVWYNATIRGDSNPVVIGDNTLIGMGAIILNGAKIGKNCIIGAGALVTQNSIIPDGTLAFGNPAKVIRKLTPEEIGSNKENALHYVEASKEQLGGSL